MRRVSIAPGTRSWCAGTTRRSASTGALTDPQLSARDAQAPLLTRDRAASASTGISDARSGDWRHRPGRRSAAAASLGRTERWCPPIVRRLISVGRPSSAPARRIAAGPHHQSRRLHRGGSRRGRARPRLHGQRHEPRHIARWAADHGVPLIHFSTDYVFDGSGTRPWREDDLDRPAQRLRREQARRRRGDPRQRAGPHLIVRTSWVYAAQGRNFLRTIARLAASVRSCGLSPTRSARRPRLPASPMPFRGFLRGHPTYPTYFPR